MNSSAILCPSSACYSGVQLIGVVLANGHVAFSAERRFVDEQFVAEAQSVGEPEKYFRFASPCAYGGCSQWTGQRCGVIDTVLADKGDTRQTAMSNENLPDCTIRAQCRWFQQSGGEACMVCPEVITNSSLD